MCPRIKLILLLICGLLGACTPQNATKISESEAQPPLPTLPATNIPTDLPAPLPSPTSTPTARETAQVFYLQGVEHHHHQKWDLAIEAFSEALSIDPEFAEAYIDRGLCYYGDHKLEEALSDFESALVLDYEPQTPQMFVNRGRAYSILEDFDQALLDFEKALALDEQFVEAYVRRGNIYAMDLSDFELAFQDFEQAIAFEADSSLAYQKWGYAYYIQDNYEAAIEKFDQAISLNPDDKLAYLYRGLSYAQLDELVPGIENMQKVIALDLNFSEPHLHLGYMFYVSSDLDQAELHIEKALELGLEDEMDAYARDLLNTIQEAPGLFEPIVSNVPADAQGRFEVAAIYNVSLSPDGESVAIAGANGVAVYQVGTFDLVWFHRADQEVASVAFSPSGEMLASGSADATISVWEAASGKHLQTLKGHTLMVSSLAFSPNESMLASGSWNGNIKLWDLASGDTLSTLAEHADGVNSVAFSPDGETLASAGVEGMAILWEVASGTALHMLEGHPEGVFAVAFSPDGNTLATGMADVIALWDIGTGERLRTIEGPQGGIFSVSFSPDGGTLASGSGIGNIDLWEIASGNHVRTLEGHSFLVSGMAFSPDGGALLSGSWDNSVIVWDVVLDEADQTITIGVPDNPEAFTLLAYMVLPADKDQINTIINNTLSLDPVSVCPSIWIQQAPDLTLPTFDVYLSASLEDEFAIAINPVSEENNDLGLVGFGALFDASDVFFKLISLSAEEGEYEIRVVVPGCDIYSVTVTWP